MTENRVVTGLIAEPRFGNDNKKKPHARLLSHETP